MVMAWVNILTNSLMIQVNGVTLTMTDLEMNQQAITRMVVLLKLEIRFGQYLDAPIMILMDGRMQETGSLVISPNGMTAIGMDMGTTLLDSNQMRAQIRMVRLIGI